MAIKLLLDKDARSVVMTDGKTYFDLKNKKFMSKNMTGFLHDNLYKGNVHLKGEEIKTREDFLRKPFCLLMDSEGSPLAKTQMIIRPDSNRDYVYYTNFKVIKRMNVKSTITWWESYKKFFKNDFIIKNINN
ncbi:MAG: hypothetical protein SLAVMIC_00942 [uncultured marine phage]|uniref:Uncharacterized protein n=1 Tax=uncultured marine phage TaxID=707152 RepID=A0A8D9FRI7_9VIRU|nr:MAG: hypothetical protein SLAVMIC_00942 [uncultured marine phage]